MIKGLVSVVVPVYNCDKFLDNCISSVLAQTYQNIELILVDDGSTDHSGEICKKFALLDYRVRYIAKKNQGVSRARNDGIIASKGEFLQFVDADDYIHADMCQVLVTTIVNSRADVVVCGYKVHSCRGISCTNGMNTYSRGSAEFSFSFVEAMEKTLFNSPCNKLYKCDLVHSLFDENISLGEDLLFNLDYFSNCTNVLFIPQCLYVYRKESMNSLSSGYRDGLLEIAVLLHNRVCEFASSTLGGIVDADSLDNFFLRDLYYVVKKLVFCGNGGVICKIQKLREYMVHHCVKNIKKDIRINDSQVRIFWYLASRGHLLAVYMFFLLKRLLSK